MNTPFFCDRMAELVFKDITHNLSLSQALELNAIIESSPAKKKLYEELIDPENMKRELQILLEFDTEASWQEIKHHFQTSSAKKLTKYNFFLSIRRIVRDLLH